MNIWHNKLFRLLYLVSIVAGILSCTKNVVGPDVPEQSQSSNQPLEFTIVVDDVKSNALINDAEALQQYPISILASASKEGSTYHVFNNDRLDFSEGIWDYGTAKYWIHGARYAFAAFAPYVQTGASDNGTGKILSNGTATLSEGSPELKITGYNTVACTSEVDARSEDLLVAHYVRDNTSSVDYSAVPLEFKHLLSCVSFSIRNTTNSDITKVSNISLNGLQYLCDITLNTSSVTLEAKEGTGIINSSERNPGAGSTAFLPKGMSEDDYKPLFDCEVLTLLPQTLYNKQIILNLTTHRANDSNGTVYSYNLGNIDAVREWKPGIKYNYSISITSTDILFQVSEVPWIEHDVEL